MTYATEQDLVDRAGAEELLQVADRDGDDVADAAVIAAALAAADERIDAYLATRFRVPLSVVPSIVRGWAVAIARYTLHRDGAPDHVVRDYKDAVAELEKARDGKIAVPDAEGITPAAARIGATRTEGSEPAFSREKLEGWL